MTLQDGIKQAMQGMLDLYGPGNASPTSAAQGSAISSRQAELSAASDPATDQELTEAALDAAWQDFKAQSDRPVAQVSCSFAARNFS